VPPLLGQALLVLLAQRGDPLLLADLGGGDVPEDARAGQVHQRRRLAVEPGALVGREPDDVPGAAGLAAGLGQGLAVLRAEDLADPVRALVGQGGRAQQDIGALVGGVRRQRAAPVSAARIARSTSPGPAEATSPTVRPS
jgi:hypothetical protein